MTKCVRWKNVEGESWLHVPFLSKLESDTKSVLIIASFCLCEWFELLLAEEQKHYHD